LGAGDPLLRRAAGPAVPAAFVYAIQGLAYVALPVAVFWLAARPRLGTLVQSLWPAQPGLRMLAILLWAPLILPFVTAPMIGAELTPLWTMQGWFLLPILLLAPADVVLPRAAAIKVCGGLLVVTAAMLVAAPAIALLRHNPGDTKLLRLEDYRATEQAAAQRVTAIWREATGRPLTIVAGLWAMPAYAVTFYSPDHPDSVVAYVRTDQAYDLSKSPWVTPDRLRREGWLAVCAIGDEHCLLLTNRLAAGRALKRVEFEIVATFWGWSRPPVTYIAFLTLPEN
jgi:hypothetical protein